MKPEIEISRLGGFKVERPAIEGLEEKVEGVLKRLREQNGAWQASEEGRPEADDMVSVEIERLEDGAEGGAQPYQFVLGRGDAISDIEEAIKSLEVGQNGDFVVQFPDDFPNEERRGQEEHLRIRLESRHVLELPELDSDFAKSLGDFEGIGDLVEKARSDVREELEQQVESVVRNRLIELILEANPFTVPVSMVDRYVESLLGNPEGVPPEKILEAQEADLAPSRARREANSRDRSGCRHSRAPCDRGRDR